MRFLLPYNCYRVMGITGLFLLLYIVVIGVFGRVDISGLLPIKLAAGIQAAWPKMPFFSVEKETVDGGKGEEIYYTVPSRQLTPQEVAGLMANKPKPAGKTPDAAAATAKTGAR
jgi:hypothetical protein